ncbi:uncharacterized protein LOC114178160 [Vigna unguiculata]|uniref:uncharacterized protein LOC114178160 n=1 Tax=Vigna unguiculata TaxID=3917 RepID=UPI001016B9E7|nr:uncharacterized protein LOC114178160 [Vigna unguiculata]
MTPKTGKAQGALKINKESQTIKKSSVSKVQHKEPVIIYTQSPRIIQTHPRHFMELVQKLTGIYRSDIDDTVTGDVDAFKPATPPLKGESEENEASASVSASVITDEEDSCNSMGEVRSNSSNSMEPYVDNFAVLESDFFSTNSNTSLLHFADFLL